MKIELPEIRPEDRTPLVEALLGIIRLLLDRVGPREQTTPQLRDEIAKLQGQKPRPDLQPSLLEATQPKPAAQAAGKRPGSAKRPKTAERHLQRAWPLHSENLPVGATFGCYEAYVVQERIIQNENTRYLRARSDVPGGGSLRAPFPLGVLPVEGGHFGANRSVSMLDQYHQAQVTEPRLLAQLWEYGIDISAGQLQRILTEDQEVFHCAKGEVLAAGLETASYSGTDDTGARHQGKNGYCTAIGNDLFAYVASTDSKSRLNFLQVRQGTQRDYTSNELTLAYWQRQQLPATPRALWTPGPQAFAGEDHWKARLAELASTDERQVRLATEGALLGGWSARGVPSDLGVLSDGAPQFVVLIHAACWVHADRPLAKLVPHHEAHRAAIAKVRTLVWDLYKDLKA